MSAERWLARTIVTKPCCSNASARSPMPGRKTKRHLAGPEGFAYSNERSGSGAAMGPTHPAKVTAPTKVSTRARTEALFIFVFIFIFFVLVFVFIFIFF